MEKERKLAEIAAKKQKEEMLKLRAKMSKDFHRMKNTTSKGKKSRN